jgi:hypothetical protein
MTSVLPKSYDFMGSINKTGHDASLEVVEAVVTIISKQGRKKGWKTKTSFWKM